jgi:hypothetical protein
MVGEAGFESAEPVEFTVNVDDSRGDGPTRVDVSARELVAIGPSETALESALARAIEGAVDAGQWAIVAALVRELEARRPRGT